MSNSIHCEDRLIDLACDVLGGSVLAASDEFFAPRHNLVRAAAPVWLPDKYIDTGKWMDGWETRRRSPGPDDWSIIRLGLRGRLETIIIDTAFFTGNFPAQAAIEAIDAPPTASVAALQAAEWSLLVAQTALKGDNANRLTCLPHGPVSHLRLRIFPDGGVARLRALGVALPNWNQLNATGSLVDLLAVENGGRVLGCSDDFFGPPINLILPNQARDMSEGWETRRRRGPGHDWAAFEFDAPGRLFAVELDTSWFRGNSPAEFSLEGARGIEGEIPEAGWTTLLSRRSLQPHTRHRFSREIADHTMFSHVRLRIFPDGGLSRLRLWGRTEEAESMMRGLFVLNTAESSEAEATFTQICGSGRWAQAMVASRPFLDVASLERRADRVWSDIEANDWLEAFAAHPEIGGEKTSGGDSWPAREQAGIASAEAGSLEQLTALNARYREKFGFIFIVCASGKSAEEMLALLKERINSDREQEIKTAADEQRKITHLRIRKWLLEAQ